MKIIPFVALLVMAIGSLGSAQESDTSGPVYVSDPVVPTLTPAFRELPDYVPDPAAFGLEMKRRDSYGFVPIEYNHPPRVDPLLQLQAGKNFSSPTDSAFSTLIHAYAGQTSTVSPPDTNGDVGPTYFVQATNQSVSTVAFINKATGAFTTKALDLLASTSPCNSGFCDPVVVYDRAADRWILSELPSRTGDVCVYVSTSGDPTGTYYAYAFAIESSTDYPKYGVWPQNGAGGSYLLGVNASSTNGYWDLFALDRAKMLAGQAATFQKFQVPALANAGFQLVLPSHMEGSIPPPAGEAAIFARPHDDENDDIPAGNTPGYDWIDLWALSVDWTTPANSTFTKLPNVNIADYDMTLCGMGTTWNCMPQPGTAQKIDPIREPLHFPLHYRNLGDHQALVGTFVEDVDGTDHAAARWFELRKPESGGSWTLYQEGVIGGESGIHRSVGSISMDGMGNIAIGYTRTGGNSPYYPSIHYSGRQISDPLGTMPNYDLTIVDSAYSKTSDERWGDYSGMATDPSDDCTFWFTTEYMGSGNVCNTSVAAFNFSACTTLSPLSSILTDSCASGGAGNGNGVIDPGETIGLDVKLRNGLSSTLSGVNATLSASTPGITVLGAADTYADFTARAVQGSNAPHFTFAADPAVPLGTAIAMNLHVTAASGGGPWDIPLAYVVGTYTGGGDVTAAQATTPLAATSAAATSAFMPSFTLAAADTATLAYSFSYTGPTATLFGPDDMAALGNWTTGGTVTVQTATHCGHSASYARLAGTSSSITLTSPVSTVGYTNIHVRFDSSLSTTQGTPVLRMDWYNGSTWTTADTSPVAIGWNCANDITLPAGAEGKAGFKVRFTFTNTTATRYGYVDYVSITGSPAASGTWTANARVSLVDPSSAVIILKAYGEADANPYSVQPYYTGAGAYQIRVEENVGDVATITGAGLHVVKAAGYVGNVCATASSAPPPVKDSGAAAARLSKGSGNTLNVTYDAASCSAQKLIILYNTIGTWTGYAGCALGDGGNGGSTSFDSTGQTSTWYNLVWTQGTTAGHPGFAFDGTSTTTRTWNVGSFCGMTTDDKSKSTCP